MSNEPQQSVIVEIKFDRIQQAVNDCFENVMKSAYGNPIKDAVKKAFKEKSGEVEIIVKQIISESLSNPDFKEKLGAVVLQNLVKSAALNLHQIN